MPKSLLLWDAPSMTQATRELLASNGSSTDLTVPMLKVNLAAALGFYVRTSRLEAEQCQAIYFRRLPRSDERSAIINDLIQLQQAGWWVNAQPVQGAVASVGQTMARMIKERLAAGELSELTIASHDSSSGLTSAVQDALEHGVAVSILGYQFKDKSLERTPGIIFIELDTLYGAFDIKLHEYGQWVGQYERIPPGGKLLAPLIEAPEPPLMTVSTAVSAAAVATVSSPWVSYDDWKLFLTFNSFELPLRRLPWTVLGDYLRSSSMAVAVDSTGQYRQFLRSDLRQLTAEQLLEAPGGEAGIVELLMAFIGTL